MTVLEARKIVKRLGDVKYQRSDASDFASAYMFLEAVEKFGPVVEALEKFETDFRSMAMQQKRKLVLGQTLKSASKNWEEFPEMLSIEFGSLFKALESYRRDVLGENANN